jgi:dTDP-4-amino-4,6-dideoxygalactose transaminase
MGLMLCLEYGKPYGIQTTAFNWWSDLYICQFLQQDIHHNINYNDIDRETWLPVEEGYRNRNLYLNTFGSIGETGLSNTETVFDSTHCLGANIEDIGLAHVFSLAPTKLVTSCEGGLIITNDKNLYNWAKEKRDRMCRMSEVHAVIGLTTLLHLEEVLEWKRTVYEYYKKHIPGLFQKIPYNSNYNTIGFINTEGLTIPEHIEYRQYYEPLKKGLVNTDYVYKNIICLPSFYNCDYKQIVSDILEANE